MGIATIGIDTINFHMPVSEQRVDNQQRMASAMAGHVSINRHVTKEMLLTDEYLTRQGIMCLVFAVANAMISDKVKGNMEVTLESHLLEMLASVCKTVGAMGLDVALCEIIPKAMEIERRTCIKACK